MSRMTPKSTAFIYEIKRAIENKDYRYSNVKVYYDAGKWSKRDYVAEITVIDWDGYDTKYLKERMRKAGATNIIGGIKHAMVRDYLDLAFDIKKSKLKQLGLDIQ